MLLNIFNGVLMGVGLKVLILLISRAGEGLGATQILKGLLLKPNGELTILGEYFGVSLIATSVLLAGVYTMKAKVELAKSKERRFSLRIGLLVLLCSVFKIWEVSGRARGDFGFLWMYSLFIPDTIGHINEFPINPLALMTIGVYLVYLVVLGKKRRTINPWLHSSCALTFFLLSYNSSSGFYLFWLIQSASLLWLAKKIPKMIEK